MPPRTRYVRHEEARIAYQVVGKGPDLLVVPGFISHLHLFWAMPKVAAMFHKLASFSRLILFDKAGTGVSDPISHVPTLEERMEEVNAVLDAVGSERAALLGLSEGGLMSILFAATYPQRTLALALYGAFPCGTYDDEFPPELREPVEHLTAEMFDVVDHWGHGHISGDRTSWNLGFFERAAVNRAMARGMVEVGQKLDLRPVLGAVHVPTVVIHRSDDPFPIGAARWMAERIPGSRFVELAGDAHPPWRGDMDAVVDEIKALVTAPPADREPDRALLTVVVTDVVSSPSPTAGDDRAPEELLRLRQTFVNEQLERFGARAVKSTGNDVLAAFEGPERAIRCAHAIAAEVPTTIGPAMRAGVHTGECELVDGDLAGPALGIGTRLAELAKPGEVLVSTNVKNLVAGSGLTFADRADYHLNGAAGRLGVHELATSADGTLHPVPADPKLAARPIESLTAGERFRLAVARWAPGLGRVAAPLFAKIAGRRK